MLRLCVGAVFLAHGAQKLLGMWGGPGLDGTADDARQPRAALPLSARRPAWRSAEFGGGVLLILGGLTRWVALALVVDMAVAIWKVHYPNGFFLSVRPAVHGIEYRLVLLGALALPDADRPGRAVGRRVAQPVSGSRGARPRQGSKV